MKAIPMALMEDVGFSKCAAEYATHVKLNFPGPTGTLILPVIQYGRRQGTGCWSWNGSTEAPTLKPSILTEGVNKNNPSHFRCHTFVNDGNAQFLDDCSHDLRGKTLPMLDVTE